MRTAALLAGALALFVVLGLVTEHHHQVGIDDAAFDVIAPLRFTAGLRVIRVVTELGSYPVVALIGLAGALLAARRGDRLAAWTLAGGVLAIIFLVGAAKGLWDRPRPQGRYYTPQGTSYPSGHSAYAIVWIAAAMATGRRGLIVAAGVVAVSIGLMRLYLHVHYLTDVLGGFALGAAVFAPLLARPR